MTKLSDKIFHDEEAARVHFERIRWPDGRVCPHCGTVDNSTLLKGKSTRPGLYKCKDCRKPFTATMGTTYERSHIPLHKWLLATHLMVSSKKGISAMQLHRNLEFGSYRTAWFMAHRIREAMRNDDTTGSYHFDKTTYTPSGDRQAGADNQLTDEVTPKMLDAGVRELLFWLDGASLVTSQSWNERVARAVYGSMVEERRSPSPTRQQSGNSSARIGRHANRASASQAVFFSLPPT